MFLYTSKNNTPYAFFLFLKSPKTLSTLINTKAIKYHDIQFVKIQWTTHREIIKTTAAIGCEWKTLMDSGWMKLTDEVSNPKWCIMVSYDNNDKSIKYQKHKHKTDNSSNNINNSKNNNYDENTIKIVVRTIT